VEGLFALSEGDGRSAVKAAADVGVATLALLGPAGVAVATGYFVVDVATGNAFDIGGGMANPSHQPGAQGASSVDASGGAPSH
jgi:hypothetical protein